MKVVLLNFATAKEPWFQQANELYSKKIAHFINFEIKALKTKAAPRDSNERKLQFEEARLLAELDSRDEVWVFDEKGKSPGDSLQFAKEFQRAIGSGKTRVVFVIGGAYGLGSEVKKRAERVFSLSGLTMNHLLAQVMVLEQVYRACTLWKGIPYHNE